MGLAPVGSGGDDDAGMAAHPLRVGVVASDRAGGVLLVLRVVEADGVAVHGLPHVFRGLDGRGGADVELGFTLSGTVDADVVGVHFFEFLSAVGIDLRSFCVLLLRVEVKDRYFGIGSGSEYALGALHAGASLAEAVRIAAKLDNGTGNRIQVEGFNNA